MGYSPWGCKESGRTEQLSMHTLYIEHKVVVLYYQKKKKKTNPLNSKANLALKVSHVL